MRDGGERKNLRPERVISRSGSSCFESHDRQQSRVAGPTLAHLNLNDLPPQKTVLQRVSAPIHDSADQCSRPGPQTLNKYSLVTNGEVLRDYYEHDNLQR